jgi:Glycosyltransferase family 87
VPLPAVGELERDPRTSTPGGAASVTVERAPAAAATERSTPRGAASVLGLSALAAVLCGSVYLAVGAAGGTYLLELPTTASPGWITGPLGTLAGHGNWLQPAQLSAGLIVMIGGYLVALACAGSISTRLALGTVVLANLAFTLGPTIVSTDVFGYIAYGRELALHGLDPYVSPPLALAHDSILRFVYWQHQPSPYGPLFSIASAPLGFVSGAVALWTYKLAAGAAGIAIALVVSSIARQRGLDPARAAIFVGLNPAVLFYAVSGAHNDLLAVCLVVIGLALIRRGMEGRGAGAAVAGAAIKLTVGLALPFLVIAARRRGRAVRGAAIAMVLLGVPTLVLFGSHFVDQVHRIATDPLFDTLFSGPDRLAAALGTHITPAIRTLCTSAAGLIALAAFIAAWRGADAVAAAGWAFLALVASVASFAPWYLVWLLPFAALGHSRPLRVATLLVTLYVIAVHVPAFGGVPWLSRAPGSTVATRTVAGTGSGEPQPAAGSISSTLPAPAFATNTLPVRGSTANVFG